MRARRRIVFCAVFGLAATTSFAAAAAAATGGPTALEFPPLMVPPSTEHHVGKVIWADLVTTDIATAEKFYGGLFGWTFREIESGKRDFVIAYLGGQPIAGMVRRDLPKDHSRQPAWLPFIAVRNVVEAQQVAIAQGGKVLSRPQSHPRRGEQAVFADPQGAVFAVLASASGDPPDVLAEPGAWIWSSLITRDPDTDAAFYQKVFGYQVYDLAADASEANDARGGDAKILHLVLASDDFARGSANAFPADRPNIHPHWINFVRVEDATDAAQKAVSLGGRVLVAPHVDRHGGRIAVLADPSGARIGVMEWTDTDPKEAAK
jgi:predicted enzyme related to lactoylglutathione lyase